MIWAISFAGNPAGGAARRSLAVSQRAWRAPPSDPAPGRSSRTCPPSVPGRCAASPSAPRRRSGRPSATASARVIGWRPPPERLRERLGHGIARHLRIAGEREHGLPHPAPLGPVQAFQLTMRARVHAHVRPSPHIGTEQRGILTGTRMGNRRTQPFAPSAHGRLLVRANVLTTQQKACLGLNVLRWARDRSWSLGSGLERSALIGPRKTPRTFSSL
jgi:hypothetical protein